MSLDAQLKTKHYNFNDVVKQIEDSGITSICRTINKFNQIMNNDNVASKNRDLENLVKNDIRLSTEVLKIANSALFRTVNHQGIDNIGNAIMIIGWDTIYKMGMSLTVKGLIKTAKARTFANWMILRAITVSHICEVFLASLKKFNPNLKDINSIYAYGLLHDIGALGLLQIIENYMQDVMEIKLLDEKKSWCDAEQSIYGFNHNTIGEHILHEARMPRSFSIVSRYHHNPDASKYSKVEAQKISLIRLAQAVLVDKHKFSEHEAFCNFKSIEESGVIRDFDHLSENLQLEFEEHLGLTSDIYSEIKTTKLTSDFVDELNTQFQN